MTAKHTPEPWTIRRVADEIAIESPHAHTNYHTICQIWHTAGSRCEPAETDLVAMANAELLVRAPRLARALIALRETLARTDFEIRDKADFYVRFGDVQRAMFAADQLLDELKERGVL